MSFEEEIPNQDSLVTDLNRSITEILDSLNCLTGSFGEMVGTLESVMAASGVRDELFTREIRQTQQNLVEFRHKVEKLSSDQQHFNDRSEKILPNTIEILSKLELLSKDIMRYIMELTDRGWEKYQSMGDSVTKNLGEIKQIYQDINNRCNQSISEFSKPNAVLLDHLQRIDNLVKSCDQSLHTIKISLPLDLSETLRRANEDRDGEIKEVKRKLEVLLQAYYQDNYKNEDGTSMDLLQITKSWITRSIFTLISRYLLYFLMFILGGWYFKGALTPLKSIPPPGMQQSQQQTSSPDLEKNHKNGGE